MRTFIQVIDGPGARDVAMDQRKRPRHVGIAQTGQPSHLALGQLLDVAAYRLDEQQLGHLLEHGLRPGPASRHFLCGVSQVERIHSPAASPSCKVSFTIAGNDASTGLVSGPSQPRKPQTTRARSPSPPWRIDQSWPRSRIACS
jgi:hypothetical protein